MMAIDGALVADEFASLRSKMPSTFPLSIRTTKKFIANPDDCTTDPTGHVDEIRGAM
jgi:hypothetical protein